MPSKTLSTTADNFARIVAALKVKHGDRPEGETDEELWERDLRNYYTGMVSKNERNVAAGAILADLNITEVT